MQRLVDKIANEFQQNSDYIEVGALDGNGDSFQVYQGQIKTLAPFHFANVLRHPSCFYFFSVTALPNETAPELDVQRDICWLTDPAPPTVSARSHNSVSVTWPFVCFCGINPPALIDSVHYILEISDGVDYKPGYFTRFISDVCAVDYRPVCSGVNINSTTVGGLLPARWYHLRLCIEYFGQRFQSESTTFHTSTWVPSPTAMPRVHIVPVRSSFDLQSEAPVRLEMQVTWNPSSPNGCNVLKYQCQVQRFDAHGMVIESDEAVQRKIMKSSRKPRLESPDRDRRANQWTQSPGRNALQIHNSLVLADRSPSRSRSRQGKPHSPTTRDKSDHDNDNDRVYNNSKNNSKSKDKQRDFSPHRLPLLADSMLSTPSQGRRFKWEILFENILTNVRTASPTADEAEWHLRVRAKNSEGWSDFSPVLKINKLTHPSLFVPPPPLYAYGTQYYSDNVNAEYLDGSEKEEFLLASTPKSHEAAFDFSGSQVSHTGGGVKNELFLNHDLQQATSMKHAASEKTAAANRTSMQSKKSSERPMRENSTTDRLEPIYIPNHPNMNTSMSAGSLGSGGELHSATRGMHVLNFKEGNNWDTSSTTSSAAEKPTEHVQFSPKKRNDSQLPSLMGKTGSSSSTSKFQRGRSSSRDVSSSFN